MEKTPEEWLAEERARRGQPAEPVDPGPTGRILGAERARKVEPFVRQVRQELFGSPDPPESPAWPVRSQDLDDHIKRITAATGFDRARVLAWILNGKRPSLARAYVDTHDGGREEIPGVGVVERRAVTLTMHAPIHEEEITRIWREYIRPAWGDLEGDGRSRLRGREFSDLDDHLYHLMDGEKTKTRPWREILEQWRQTPMPGMTIEEWRTPDHDGPGDVTENALRFRWHRIQELLDDLEGGGANAEA